MDRLIRYLIYSMLLTSCSSCILLFPHKTFNRGDQSMLFSANYNPALKNKLNINGIFTASPKTQGNYKFILYEDGTFATINNLSLSYNEEKSFFCLGGIYKIISDTLIIDEYTRDTYNTIELNRYKYAILNRTTLKRITEELFRTYGYKKINVENDNYIYNFIDISILPSSYGVEIKSKKWMWADKQEWKEYMRQLKEYEAARRKNQQPD